MEWCTADPQHVDVVTAIMIVNWIVDRLMKWYSEWIQMFLLIRIFFYVCTINMYFLHNKKRKRKTVTLKYPWREGSYYHGMILIFFLWLIFSLATVTMYCLGKALLFSYRAYFMSNPGLDTVTYAHRKGRGCPLGSFYLEWRQDRERTDLESWRTRRQSVLRSQFVPLARLEDPMEEKLLQIESWEAREEGLGRQPQKINVYSLRKY